MSDTYTGGQIFAQKSDEFEKLRGEVRSDVLSLTVSQLRDSLLSRLRETDDSSSISRMAEVLVGLDHAIERAVWSDERFNTVQRGNSALVGALLGVRQT